MFEEIGEEDGKFLARLSEIMDASVTNQAIQKWITQAAVKYGKLIKFLLLIIELGKGLAETLDRMAQASAR